MRYEPTHMRGQNISTGSSLGKMPRKPCDWCGEEESWLWGVPYLQGGMPRMATVCSTCKRRADYPIEELFAKKGPRRDDPPPVVDLPPSEDEFAPLFAAACALFDEGVEAEEIIIPTLAFAAERIRGSQRHVYGGDRLSAAWQDPKTRKEEVGRFEATFKRLEVFKIKNDTLMLEHRAVWGDLSLGMRDGGLGNVEPAFLVMLGVNLNHKLAEPDQVARCYEEILAAEGLRCGNWASTDFSHYYYDSSLMLKVMSNRLPSTRRYSLGYLPFHPAYLRDYLDHYKEEPYKQDLDMPHPDLVQKHYESLRSMKDSGQGLGEYATARKRGRRPDARNLVLACVAWYLRNYGKIQSPTKIHQLLNSRVLRADTLPKGWSTSKSNMLWRSVKGLSPRLLAESRT